MLSVAVNVRVWWRDRRTDGVAEGKAGGETRETIARLDERLRRAEQDIAHCVRADLLAQHLAAMEARFEARRRPPRED